MKHKRIDVEKLTQRLRQATGARSLKEIAIAAKVDPSRVTRFLNGDFKKMTAVLRRVCAILNVPVDDFMSAGSSSDLPPEILTSLQRIVGRDPARAAVATRLLRSLELLTERQAFRSSAKGRS